MVGSVAGFGSMDELDGFSPERDVGKDILNDLCGWFLDFRSLRIEESS